MRSRHLGLGNLSILRSSIFWADSAEGHVSSFWGWKEEPTWSRQPASSCLLGFNPKGEVTCPVYCTALHCRSCDSISPWLWDPQTSNVDRETPREFMSWRLLYLFLFFISNFSSHISFLSFPFSAPTHTDGSDSSYKYMLCFRPGRWRVFYRPQSGESVEPDPTSWRGGAPSGGSDPPCKTFSHYCGTLGAHLGTRAASYSTQEARHRDGCESRVVCR
jgi:hypothetical protein